MMKDYSKSSFKDFENIDNFDIHQRANAHEGYLNYLRDSNFMNYRLKVTSGCGPEIELAEAGYIKKGNYVSFVCNDYLGFTQHPKVKKAVIESIEKYEPRVKVVKVIYDGDGKEGVIYPKVRVKLNGT